MSQLEHPSILALYFIEPVLLVLLGVSLFGIGKYCNIKKIILSGLLNAVFLYVIRNSIYLSGIQIIWHIPFSLTFFIVVFKYLFLNDIKDSKVINWLRAGLAGVVGYATVIYNEIVFTPIYAQLFNLETSNYFSNYQLHLIQGLLNDINILILVLVASVIRRRVDAGKS